YMYLSRLLSKKQEHIKEFKKGFLPIIIPIIITCVLIMPANLSNALLTGATSLMLLFIGRVNLKYIFLTILIACIPLIIIVSVAVSKHNNIKQKNNITQIEENNFKKIGRWNIWVTRVQDFIYTKENEPHYQVLQAKIAIANGGLLMGLGPGNSQQRNFLPQAYNDFIFAIIIEEYGLFGGAFIIFIYIIFLFRCLKIAKKCPYAFGTLLAVALSFTLTIQAMANMAVCVNLLPVTGITLPLISLGGSSFIFTSISIGIILSVSRNVESIEGNTVPVETSNNELVNPLNQLTNE
ncbi:MAG: FtsW/RodA/SpoVE family cell cycle protein, partial [Sediminibacterium sp.]|nr:FtsW/RodA/SpoVE family cell cycle protein [Sediminibacterium sp.]